MKRTGAQALLESLVREGVDVLFGYPGGSVIDVYHELPNFSLRHILVRHEQGAVHAADGYARASGQVGVALVTSGPGATNTVTGIATAYMDSIPLVVITGQVPTGLIGNDAFQEADIVGITRPCCKHNYLVKDIKKLTRVIKEAFYLARTGRPGPVLIDIPKDIFQAMVDYEYPETISMRAYNPNCTPNGKQIKRAVEILSQSKRPILFGGGGVILSNASYEFKKLGELLNIPVVNSLMGLGSFSGEHKQWLGMIGMHGTYAANMAINASDVILSVGARFDDRVTGRLNSFAPKAKIIHVDVDPTSISKNVQVEVPIVADAKQGLSALLEEANKYKDWGSKTKQWLGQVYDWKEKNPIRYEDSSEIIKPQYVIETLYKLTKGKAIITTEVGQNQMWASQFYKYSKPRTFLTSGGLGTMGYGLPAAIGAQLACPDKLVVDVAGDGSIQMNIQEMATAVCYQLPVKIVILNNGNLGMVRQWQELFYQKNYFGTSLQSNPDFVLLAQAYGASGYRVTDKKELKATLAQAFADQKPAIVDVHVAAEENVYPMVPTGAALSEMLLV